VKTPRFEYHAPRTLDEAVALLGELGDEAKVLAGGQSLVPLLAMRLARPEHLIDVNRIPELAQIEERNGVVALGATVRHRQAERSPVVAARSPLLAGAVPYIGHVAIRSRGTIGGSIAHADASAELPAVARALDAEMVARSTRGDRVLGAGDFFQGHFTTALDDDECLVEVRLPAWPAGAGWGIHEIVRRHGDFAMAGAVAMVALGDAGTISGARVSLFGVADAPVRAREAELALVAQAPSGETLDAAAEAATGPLEPASDLHGSSAYRRQVARVAVRRALAEAARRARESA
jgi:aerobic carbon-monoxide dehydrogenase medium subunit